MNDDGSPQNGKRKPINSEEKENQWHDAVAKFVDVANELQFEAKDIRLVSTAMIFAATHYNVFEIAEGGTLPKDILSLAANNTYGSLVDLVKDNVDHLIPPENIH